RDGSAVASVVGGEDGGEVWDAVVRAVLDLQIELELDLSVLNARHHERRDRLGRIFQCDEGAIELGPEVTDRVPIVVVGGTTIEGDGVSFTRRLVRACQSD